MRFAPASRSVRNEFARLRSEGVVQSGLAIGCEGKLLAPVAVRALADEDAIEWATPLNGALDVRSGVVAFTGVDETLAASLAVIFAAWCGDRGQRVTLVDASVERPVLERPLPYDPDEGLVDAVLYGVSPQRVLRRTLTPNVSVVCAGSEPVSIEGVFLDDNFAAALRTFASDGLALVIVPGIHLARASSATDAVVCVARSGFDLASLCAAAEGRRCVSVLVGEAAREEEERTARATELRVLERTPEGTAERPVGGEASAASAAHPPGRSPVQTESRGMERAEPVTAQIVPTPAPASYRTKRPGRRRGGRAFATAAILIVVVAAAWWGLDGRTRFAPGTPELSGVTSRGVRVGEAPSAASDDVGGEGGAADDAREADGQTPVEQVPAQHTPAHETAAETPRAATITTDAEERAEIGGAGGERIAGPGGRYLVMASSQRREGDAEVDVTLLSNLGVDAEVVPTEVPDKGLWYRVVVRGGYPTYSMALEVLDTIKSLGYEGAWIERAAVND